MMSQAAVVLSLLIAMMSARAADMKLEAKLIWGSNDPTNKVQHTVIKDPKLSSDLHRIFKWDNYYEINTKQIAVAPNKTEILQMSEKCKLELKNLGSNWLEVNCIGKGKQVSKGKHSLAPGKWFTLAGNDKNNTAWFVVMRTTEK
jgi:hypothetical protein